MFDSTPGSPTSNSYVTLQEASAYFLLRQNADFWLTSMEQQQLLVTATRQLEWSFNWLGTKTDPNQALHFPATGVYDRNGVLFPDNIIPEPIIHAVCEVVLVAKDTDLLEMNPMDGFTELRIDTLVLKTNKNNTTARGSFPDHIWDILSGLYKQGQGVSVFNVSKPPDLVTGT